MSNAIKKF